MADFHRPCRFATPVERTRIAADWRARGYSCALFVDPPGREWTNFVHSSNELLAVTDGAILAAEADGAIVAVRAQKTKRDQLAHAIGMLRDVDAKLLGAVLTMLPTRGSGSYRYNYYYSGSYGDGKSEESSQTS